MRTILLGIVAAVALATAAYGQSADERTKVQSVITSQIESFRTRAHERAFSHATPGLQRMFGSTDRFISMVQSGYAQIYGAKRWSFERSRMNGRQLFQEVRVTGPKGRDWVALYTMEQQADGSWKIAGVQIVPDRARTT